jgi:uncharacterized membrane-anchored protein
VQKPDAYVVTIIREPEPGMTVADLIIGSLGLAGTLLIVSLLFGLVVGAILVVWHRLRPRPWRPMPPVSPSIPGPDFPQSSRVR